MGTRVRVVVSAYALLALLVVPVFPHFVSPNETTRWALAAAVVEERSLEIRKPAALLGPSFEDVSEKDGRLYSNKAPGLAFLALPGYLLARPFVGVPSFAALRPSLDAMRLFGATLPAILLALLVASAGIRSGGWESRAPTVVFALLFATPLSTYGLLLFSHALVALCLFGAFAALFLPGDPRRAAWKEVGAGALLGLAVVSEYPAALPALVLVAVAGWTRRPARLLRIGAGAFPFVAALLLYDRACFGGPFELSSAHERFAGFGSLAAKGAFGIGLPSPVTLASLLADPSKGLLVFSPFLFLSLFAYPVAARVLTRGATVTLALVPVSLVLLYAGYPNWHGGFTVGARYLVAALPFLVFPFFFRGGGRLEALLLGASTAAVGLPTLVFPFVPRGVPYPWASFALPLLKHGLVAPNLLHLVWRPLAIAAPFAIVLAAAAAALPRRCLPAFLLGAAGICVGALLLLRLEPPQPAVLLQRAYIEDVYFERGGALERAIAATRSPQPRLLARRVLERALPPASWPFGGVRKDERASR